MCYFSEPRPGDQMLLILLGDAAEAHQIMQFSAQIAHAQLLCRGFCVRWHVAAVPPLFS